MKNYQKIYNRLVKEIKEELYAHYNCPPSDLLQQVENSYGITVLEWVLSTLDEIEGKRCTMNLMNEKEFKKWQEKIKK